MLKLILLQKKLRNRYGQDMNRCRCTVPSARRRIRAERQSRTNAVANSGIKGNGHDGGNPFGRQKPADGRKQGLSRDKRRTIDRPYGPPLSIDFQRGDHRHDRPDGLSRSAGCDRHRHPSGQRRPRGDLHRSFFRPGGVYFRHGLRHALPEPLFSRLHVPAVLRV